MTSFASLIPNGVYVDGSWRTTKATFQDVNPTTEQAFADVPDGTVDDMDAAIAAARRVADEGSWARTSIAERAKCLTQLAEALDRHKDEIAELATVEWGVAPPTRGMQIDVASYHATDMVEKAEAALADEEFGNPDWGISAIGMYAPLGVVAAITPWNFPHTINLQKIAPALIAGNTFVLKPSPLSPLAGLILAKLVDEETDIPAGVVNVVSTSASEPSVMLTTDPRVDMVTFVGSAATARHVGAAAAGTMKRTLMELGGKSAAVFLDDWDLAGITPELVEAACTLHAGQACILHSRLLVHEKLYDDFVDRFSSLAAATKVGDPSDPDTQMGPLINEAARERVLGMVAQGVADGARLVTGGGTPAGLDTGYFVEPTVLADVDNATSIAQEEVFGPVTCIIKVRSDDEAVAIANDSQYGLVGTVHSPDLDRGRTVARRIDTGVCTLNGAPPFGPYGGWKQSGIGREGGIHGIRTYTELRTVTQFG
jgi:acyl-CoA reductase-like NAD-dependent aldehyde dehydrogenase